MIDELKRRGKVLLDDSCPYCEKDFEVPPEWLLIVIEGTAQNKREYLGTTEA